MTFEQVPASFYDRARPTPAADIRRPRCARTASGEGASHRDRLRHRQATLPLAERGYEITCVELGEQLAAVARHKLASFPNVEVINTNFEGWEPDCAEFEPSSPLPPSTGSPPTCGTRKQPRFSAQAGSSPSSPRSTCSRPTAIGSSSKSKKTTTPFCRTTQARELAPVGRQITRRLQTSAKRSPGVADSATSARDVTSGTWFTPPTTTSRYSTPTQTIGHLTTKPASAARAHPSADRGQARAQGAEDASGDTQRRRAPLAARRRAILEPSSRCPADADRVCVSGVDDLSGHERRSGGGDVHNWAHQALDGCLAQSRTSSLRTYSPSFACGRDG